MTACTRALSLHSLLAVSSGGVRCYSKRSSYWILVYFDRWLVRSACHQRVLLALLSPCMSPMAMFLEGAYVLTSLSFGGGGACYGMISAHITNLMVILRRASEASLFFLGFSKEKKPLHNGSYEHKVPKIKNKTLFCTSDVCDSGMCVIQHRNWPHRSTILNARGTNASPDGLCTRTHNNEAFSCWFYCNSFRVDRARRGNGSSVGMLSYRSACPEI